MGHNLSRAVGLRAPSSNNKQGYSLPSPTGRGWGWGSLSNGEGMGVGLLGEGLIHYSPQR